MTKLDSLKAEIRAWRYPDGHSGISDKVYMKQHNSDEALINFLFSKGLINGQDSSKEISNR